MKKDDGCVEILRYKFNMYTVSAVLKTVIHVRNEMLILLEEDAIKELDGYSLLEDDLKAISSKLNEIEI